MANRRLRGMLFGFTGILFVGPDALLLRYAVALGGTIWRIIAFKLIVVFLTSFATVACIQRREGLKALPKALQVSKRHIAVASVLQALVDIGFPVSIMLTKAARALLLISLNPLWAATFGAYFLRERLPRHTIVALVLATSGVLVVFVPEIIGDAAAAPAATNSSDSAAVEASLPGDMVALVTGVALAAFIVTNRHAAIHRPSAPMNVASAFGGVLSFGSMMIVAMAVEGTGGLSGLDYRFWLCIVANGACVSAANILALVLAPIYITPAEVSLLILLECLFNPVWVYIGVGERPSDWTFAGGSAVLVVLMVHEARSAYLQRKAAAEAEAEEAESRAGGEDGVVEVECESL